MIQATFYKNKNDDLCGFKLTNHAESRVCAAVSALAINAANSIEKLTDADIDLTAEADGGYLEFKLPELIDGGSSEQIELLLASLELGVNSIAIQYKRQIKVFYEKFKE